MQPAKTLTGESTSFHQWWEQRRRSVLRLKSTEYQTYGIPKFYWVKDGSLQDSSTFVLHQAVLRKLIFC